MAKPLVDDELWTAVRPLLPPHKPRPKGGNGKLVHRHCHPRGKAADAFSASL